MRKKDLPEWARKFDGDGIAFREKGDSFVLLRVSSRRVEGKKYPVLTQEYLGTVTEKGGFVPANERAKSSDSLVECSLSHFIMANFRRELLRAVFNSRPGMAENKVRAAIVLFVYGSITERTVRMTAISAGREEEIARIGSSSAATIAKLSKKIGMLLAERIPDETLRNDLICALRQGMADRRSPAFRGYGAEALEILKECGGSFK